RSEQEANQHRLALSFTPSFALNLAPETVLGGICQVFGQLVHNRLPPIPIELEPPTRGRMAFKECPIRCSLARLTLTKPSRTLGKQRCRQCQRQMVSLTARQEGTAEPSRNIQFGTVNQPFPR